MKIVPQVLTILNTMQNKNMLEYGSFWKLIVLGILWITPPLIIYVAKEMSVWNYLISWVYNQ